jgi:hypothetical protein
MKNDINEAMRRRGSSPPFQESSQGSYGFVTRLHPDCQHEARPLAIQLVMELGFGRTVSTESENGPSSSPKPESEVQSFDKSMSRQDKEDTSRWQDDGGESGENV